MYAWDVCIVHLFYLCMCVCNYMWRPDIDVLYLPQSISTSLFVKDSSIHPFINLFFVCLCMSVCHSCMCVTAFRSHKKGIGSFWIWSYRWFYWNRIWFLWKSSQYFCIFVHFSSCFLVFIVLLFFPFEWEAVFLTKRAPC